MDKISCLIACGAIFAIMLNCVSSQTVHTVGDGLGWDIPPNSSVYDNWASSRTFLVGDILVFNFMTNNHDVLQVPQASYTACSQDGAIGGIITAGPANITIDAAGDHHYICTIGRHCLAGQRLAITVASTPGGGAASPPMTTPPTTPTTPSPASTQPEACPPTTSTTDRTGGPTAAMGPPTGSFSQPDSGSTSLAASLLLILLSTGIALIF